MAGMTGRCTSLCSFQALPALCSVFRIDPRLLRRNLATHVSQEERNVTGLEHAGPLPANQAWKRLQTLGPGNAEVYVDSLHETLDAHRLKNRASVIRKVSSLSLPGPNTQTAPLPVNDSPTPVSRAFIRPIYAILKERNKKLKADWIQRQLQFGEVQKLQAQRLGRRAQTLLRGIQPITEYVGLSFDPLYKHRIYHDYGGEPNEQLPWLKQLDWSSGDASSRLHSEIKSFETYMSPTAQEKAYREALLRNLRAAVEEGMPGFSLKGFGSYMTGLYAPNSDIDLFLTGPGDLNEVNETKASPTRRSFAMQSRADLKRLGQVFAKRGIYENIHILEAQIPILMGRPKDRSELSFQITTLRSSYSADEYVKKYLAEYPSFRPLFFVLKNMLWIRGFTSPFSGGLGSYPLAMAIVAWLKISESHDIHLGHRSDESLGEKLLGLLHFYGEFDLYRHGLSVEPSGKFRKRPLEGKPSKLEKEAIAEDLILHGQSKICIINKLQPYLLCLQDPGDPFNDLGRRSYGIKHIQQTIKHIFQQLKKRMAEFEQDPNQYENSGLLAPAIAGSYLDIKRRRAREGGI